MSYNSIFLILSFFLLGCDINVKEKKPNIIVFFFDDLGYGELGAYGGSPSQN